MSANSGRGRASSKQHILEQIAAAAAHAMLAEIERHRPHVRVLLHNKGDLPRRAVAVFVRHEYREHICARYVHRAGKDAVPADRKSGRNALPGRSALGTDPPGVAPGSAADGNRFAIWHAGHGRRDAICANGHRCHAPAGITGTGRPFAGGIHARHPVPVCGFRRRRLIVEEQGRRRADLRCRFHDVRLRAVDGVGLRQFIRRPSQADDADLHAILGGDIRYCGRFWQRYPALIAAHVHRAVDHAVRAREIAISNNIRIVARVKARRILAEPVVSVRRIGEVRINADIARARCRTRSARIVQSPFPTVRIMVVATIRIIPHN